MSRSVRFYRALGFNLRCGGEQASFTSFEVGASYVNLIAARGERRWWGRAIFYVDNVDALYHHVLAQGLVPDFAPSDAPWGERYFHITDPDGHELSFATPIN